MIAILDTLQTLKPDVCTIAFGQCASTATVLLVSSDLLQRKYVLASCQMVELQHALVLPMQAAGTKGKRCAMPNTRIMMHQPAGGAMGSADEVNIQAAELNRTMKVRQPWLRMTRQKVAHISVELGRPGREHNILWH